MTSDEIMEKWIKSKNKKIYDATMVTSTKDDMMYDFINYIKNRESLEKERYDNITADELFKRLGYEKRGIMSYLHGGCKMIDFSFDKTFICYHVVTRQPMHLNKHEIEAVNKFFYNMGWK